MIALYNPKTYESDGKVRPNEAHIKGFVWSHARWNLAVNELKKFPDEVGEALLRHYEFLIKVDKKNVEKIKNLQAEKKFKCKYCEFETNTKVAFLGHMKTHEGGKEEDFLEDVEEAGAEGSIKARPANVHQSPENREGIPTGGTKSQPVRDKDGVDWYGGGLEKDTN